MVPGIIFLWVWAMMQAEAIALCRFYGFILSSMIRSNPLLGGSGSAICCGRRWHSSGKSPEEMTERASWYLSQYDDVMTEWHDDMTWRCLQRSGQDTFKLFKSKISPREAPEAVPKLGKLLPPGVGLSVFFRQESASNMHLLMMMERF